MKYHKNFRQNEFYKKKCLQDKKKVCKFAE